MNNKRRAVVFTKPYTAECLYMDIPELCGDDVLVKMEYTVISGGTERANLIGANNNFG